MKSGKQHREALLKDRDEELHVCVHIETHLQLLMTELLDLGKPGTSSSLDLPGI